MRPISNPQTKNVSGSVAIMSGGCHLSFFGNMFFYDGAYILVTDDSANFFGNFAAFPNKVIDTNTYKVLFDGTQDSFCINSNSFAVEKVLGGHKYKYTGSC